MTNLVTNKYELDSITPVFISATKEQFLEICEVHAARLFSSRMLVCLVW